MNNRFYIDNFCEDLNYKNVILYIGEVDSSRLLKALKKDLVNKTYRLEYALNDKNPARKNFIYIENCDLQNLDYPLHEYMEEDYNVYVLHEGAGKYYIETKLDGWIQR